MFLDACLSRAELTTYSKTPSPVVARKTTLLFVTSQESEGDEKRVFVLEDWWHCLTLRRNMKENRLQCKKKARVGPEEQVVLPLGRQEEIWSSCVGLAVSLGLVGHCPLLRTSDDFDLCSC